MKSTVFKKLFAFCFVVILIFLSACSDSNDLAVSDIYETSKHMKLGQYKGIEVTLTQKTTVDDNDVLKDKMSKLIDNATSSKSVTERGIKLWDKIDFNYKAFDSSNTQIDEYNNQQIVVGIGDFLDEFEQKIIGMKPGDVSELTITVPASWPSAELAGQVIKFQITLNAIYEYTLPAFDDDFVFKNYGYSSVEDYNMKIKEKLQAERDIEVADEKAALAWDKAVQNCTFNSFPDDEVQSYASDIAGYYQQYASYYSLNNGALASESIEQAKIVLQEEMTAYAILTKERIKISQSDMEKYKSKLLKDDGYKDESEYTASTGNTLAATYGRLGLEKYYVLQKAREFCGENAIVTGE